MYICAHCGHIEKTDDDVLCDPPTLDTGTTFTCMQCGQDTIVVLAKPQEYAEHTALETAARAILAAVDYRCNGPDRDVRVRDLWGAAYALKQIEQALQAQ